MVDPLNPLTKEHKALTSKRKKTDEDHELIALSEMRSYLYWDKKNGIYMPASNFEASLRDAAKLNKLGQHIRRGVIVTDDSPINYKGPKDPEKLVRDTAFQFAKTVVVQRARIMRYRPIFHEWSCVFVISFDESILDRNEILTIAQNAGKFAGLGTWRPRFGRFEIEVLEG
ncbi:unnamed protein product [marine sediment metagenome]|uniref:Uncharacterized protein n=1 Tax=marine sediment metagenome TaxID=412755 RepID=X0TDZ5_9ZZZZ